MATGQTNAQTHTQKKKKRKNKATLKHGFLRGDEKQRSRADKRDATGGPWQPTDTIHSHIPYITPPQKERERDGRRKGGKCEREREIETEERRRERERERDRERTERCIECEG